MISYQLRKATAADAAAIRSLIYRVRINPTNLDWQRFIVAQDETGKFLGCGQIKPHSDGTFELASIAVQPEFHGQGIGKAIILELLAGSPRPIYLRCRSKLEIYYEKFGFRQVRKDEVPPAFRIIWSIFELMRRFFPPHMQGRIMIKTEEK